MVNKAKSGRPQLSIPRARFDRLVREIAQDLSNPKPERVLWSAEAMQGLHEEAEAFLAEHFQSAKRVCDVCDERTLGVKHFKTARALSSA